jgi:hypothetical protein
VSKSWRVVEISTGSLDVCQALIQKPQNRKTLHFNYIAHYIADLPFPSDSGIARALKLSSAISALTSTIINFHLSENTMRSELVFSAMTHVSNRFLLTMVAAKATRRLHRPNTRIQETVNDVLIRLRHEDPLARVSNTGKVQPFRRAA